MHTQASAYWKSFFPSKRWSAVAIGLLITVAAGIHFNDLFIEHLTLGTLPEIRSGAWGDLNEWNMRLEQPDEYVSFEFLSANKPKWNFGPLTSPAVRSLLLSLGCSEDQANKLLTTQLADTQESMVLQPDEDTLLSLSPEVRSKLYLLLSQNPANLGQIRPAYIPDGNVDRLFANHLGFDSRLIGLVKKLCYNRNGFTYFSDIEVVCSHLPTSEKRMEFVKILTGLDVVKARLMIRPDTDIEKPLSYWALSMPNVTLKDLRPLFEAAKSLPDGGDVSILFLLPPLARERLYTSPLPPDKTDTKIPDCFWTSLNFFQLQPDNRLSDPAFASRYLADNYYQIGKPDMAGDIVLFLTKENTYSHAAVYLADDVVFTKNGGNFGQPWVLMHLKDLFGIYSATETIRPVYFRRRGI